MAPTIASKRIQATISPTERGTFAVAIDGEIIRNDFKTRALAAMWATRQKIYRGTSGPLTKPTIPPALEDESIKPVRLLAAMSGQSYPRFMIDARAGKYGPLYPFGNKSHGLKFGLWKAGRDTRVIKVAAAE